MSSEIIVSGIDRTDSIDNPIPNSASLIINARKKGRTWEHVGDKEFKYTIQSMYTHLLWHYKLEKEDEIIAFHEQLRNICIIQIKSNISSINKKFLDDTGAANFELPAGEEIIYLRLQVSFSLIFTRTPASSTVISFPST